MQERITALAVAIKQGEGIIQTGTYGIDALHFADGDFHHGICRKHLVECGDVVAVQMVGVKDPEIADFFTIEQCLELDIHASDLVDDGSAGLHRH